MVKPADAGPFNLFWKRADGTGEAQRLTQSKIAQLPNSWHPTRPILAFHDNIPPNPQRVMLLELEGDDATGWKAKEPVEFIRDAYRNVMPTFSSDGKWLAYLSDKAGQFELYVRPFPGPGDEVQISSGGANNPKWSARRQELLYTTFVVGANTSGQIMVVPYAVQGGAFKPERPRLWSPMARVISPPLGQYGLHLDLHPDGQRFVVAETPAATSTTRDSLVVVLNFFEEVKRATSGR